MWSSYWVSDWMRECVHNRLAPGHIFPSPSLSPSPVSPADLGSAQLVTLVSAAGREQRTEAQAVLIQLGLRPGLREGWGPVWVALGLSSEPQQLNNFTNVFLYNFTHYDPQTWASHMPSDVTMPPFLFQHSANFYFLQPQPSWPGGLPAVIEADLFFRHPPL